LKAAAGKLAMGTPIGGWVMRWPITALATPLLVSILSAVTAAQTGIGVLDVWLKLRQSADAPNDRKITLYTKSKALVIGIDAHEAWPKLSNGINDSEEVAKGSRLKASRLRSRKI
jgi:hypothetical protein